MFAFVTPFWLLAIPFAAGLLFFAYLRHGKNKHNKISSLFFIKQVSPSVASGRHKISLPWRLLFELLVLISLIAALSGMFLKTSSSRAIIVVDNSLSMGALLKVGTSNGTLLDEAKRSAKSNLDLFSEIKLASVWVTSPEPHEISAGFVPSSQAREKIDGITVSFATGNVSTILTNLKDTASKIFIFSDQRNQTPIQNNNSPFRIVPINTTDSPAENVAIETISLEQTIGQATVQIAVKIHPYLIKDATCRLSLSRFENNVWSEYQSKEVSLIGSSEKDIFFNLDSNLDPKLLIALKAKIISCNRENANSLLLDDSVWLTSKQTSSSIVLVSDFTTQQLGLDGLKGIKIDQIKPQDWLNSIESKARNSAGENEKLFIFHRFVPKDLPNSNALFVSPPTGSNLFSLATLNGDTRLIRWEESSALLRYLTFPNLELRDAVKFQTLPAWASALMYSSSGPVALYGTIGQRHYAALGFEIFPFEGKKNPFLSVLTLNLLKWLTNSSQDLGTDNLRRINSDFKIADAVLLDSSSTDTKITVAPNGDYFSLNAPGLVETSSDSKKALTAVNFFSSSESNLVEQGFISIPKINTSETQKIESGLPLEIYLIILALAVLLLDSMLFLYRTSKSTGGKHAL